MRENRLSGLEGGVAFGPSLPLSFVLLESTLVRSPLQGFVLLQIAFHTRECARSGWSATSRITHHAPRTPHHASRITHHASRFHASRNTQHATRITQHATRI